MTIATLLKAALIAYGLLLGGAFLFLRFYPELAGRTVFEWGRQAIAIAGSLDQVEGVERDQVANAPVELLGLGFGDRLSRIAGEVRREVEALARAAADQARGEAVAAAEAELADLERRLAEADAVVIAASEALVPAAPPPAAAMQIAEPDIESSALVRAAASRLESARAAEDGARSALAARIQSFLADRRRRQALAQLRVATRRLAGGEGEGVEIAVENAGPLAVTGIVLTLARAGQPVATFAGRAVLASERTPLNFVPEIANEFNEKIIGLPPKYQWRMVLPVDPALDGRAGGFTAEVVDAEFAEPARLERTGPYGTGMRMWAYAETPLADLFAEDLDRAAPRFVEALAVTQAEQAVAAATTELGAVRTAVKAALLQRTEAAQEEGAPERRARAEEAAERLRLAQDARDALAAERDDLVARIGRVRAGTEPVLLTDRIVGNGWTEALDRIKRSIAARITEARLEERRSATRADAGGAFRFGDLTAGTYYIYSSLPESSGAGLHYLQRVRLQEDGGVVTEPPLTMSQEEFLYGAMDAGS